MNRKFNNKYINSDIVIKGVRTTSEVIFVSEKVVSSLVDKYKS